MHKFFTTLMGALTTPPSWERESSWKRRSSFEKNKNWGSVSFKRIPYCWISSIALSWNCSSRISSLIYLLRSSCFFFSITMHSISSSFGRGTWATNSCSFYCWFPFSYSPIYFATSSSSLNRTGLTIVTSPLFIINLASLLTDSILCHSFNALTHKLARPLEERLE